MTPDRWTETREVFHAALAQAADRRAAFLDRRCGGDADLRREVATLLAADGPARDGGFIRDAVLDAARRLGQMRESNRERRLSR